VSAARRERLGRERRACGPNRVERIVLPAQAPLAAQAAADLEHRLALLIEVAGEAGAVVAAPFDPPDANAARMTTGEAQRMPVATCVGTHRRLRQHRSRWRGNHGERVLVSMRIDTDHVIDTLSASIPTDPPTRRVRYAGLEQGNRAAGL
jgi:hypothetical protein